MAQGHNFSYNIDPAYLYELRVSNYNSSSWSGTVTANHPYEVLLNTDDGYAQEVTVKDGSEARFFFTVPEDGNYMFYGIANSRCDNYAELWVNGEKVTYDDDNGDNSQFNINYPLYADDIVELRTYMYSHSSDEGTYTIHIEKVPENYNNLTQWNIGGTSSTYVYSLAAGETKKYRFIAPSMNNNNTGAIYSIARCIRYKKA